MLETSLEAKTSAWDVQRERLAKQTAQTIANNERAIAEATEEAQAKLDELHRQVKEGGEVFLSQRVEQEGHYTKVSTEIIDLKATKDQLVGTNIELTAMNQDLRSTKLVLTTKITELTETKQALASVISDLDTEKLTLETRIDKLTAQVQDAATSLEKLRQDHVDTTKAIRQELDLLEQKKGTIILEAAEIARQNELARQEMAVWSERLESQDKNLRMREAKVQQAEEKIIRNSELLNL